MRTYAVPSAMPRAVSSAVLSFVTVLCGCVTTSEKGGESAHLWPLYEREIRPDYESLDVLWPLYSHEFKGDDVLVRQIPLFTWRHQEDHRELDVLWPLFNLEYGGDTSGLRVAPLYFRGRSPEKAYDVVFPVFWWRRDHHLHFWPLYYQDRDEGHGTLWPLVGFSEDRTKVLPFYYSRRTAGETTWFVFPYGTRTVADTRTHWVLPVYFDERGPNHQRRVILPFWLNSENSALDTRARIFFPFYWDVRDKDDHTTVFAPFYGRRHAEGRRDTYFIAPPLYIYDREKETDRTTHHILWPLYQHGQGPDYVRRRFFPFEYGWEETSNPDTEERTSRSHVRVYPLYFSGKEVSGDGGTTRYHTLFPLWWYQEDTARQERHHVVFPLLWHYRSREKATDVLFPLLWAQRNLAEDEEYYAVLWPLTWYSSSTETSDFRFLWKLVEVQSDQSEKRSHWAVNPIVRYETKGPLEKRFDFLGGLFGVHVQEDGTSFKFLYFFES